MRKNSGIAASLDAASASVRAEHERTVGRVRSGASGCPSPVLVGSGKTSKPDGGKRRRGRPARGDKQVVSQISMLSDEKDFFQEMASRTGMSLSAFARAAMSEYVRNHGIDKGFGPPH